MQKNLFFIHGITSTKESNQPLKELCSKKGINFEAIDLPGHGQEPFKKGMELTIKSFGEFAKDYIIKNNLNHDLILFGHSMGGAICAYLAANYQRELDIQKVILEDPLNGAVYHRKHNTIHHPIDALVNTRKNKSTEQKLLNNINRESKLDIVGGVLKRVPFKYIDEYIVLYKNITSEEESLRLDDYYKNINIPFYIIFGTSDRVVPYAESVNHIKQLNSQVNFIFLEGSGHSSHNDNPDFFKVELSKIL